MLRTPEGLRLSWFHLKPSFLRKQLYMYRVHVVWTRLVATIWFSFIGLNDLLPLLQVQAPMLGRLKPQERRRWGAPIQKFGLALASSGGGTSNSKPTTRKVSHFHLEGRVTPNKWIKPCSSYTACQTHKHSNTSIVA